VRAAKGEGVSGAIRAWAAELLGSQVVDSEPLLGGMTTDLHVLLTAVGDRAVLRRFPSPRWTTEEARGAAVREAWVLAHLQQTPVSAPGLVGVILDDSKGPSILMEYVRGRRYIGDGLDSWESIGAVLASIHAVRVPCDHPLPNETNAVVEGLQAGVLHRAEPHSALVEEARSSRPTLDHLRPGSLIHNDFSLSNIVFTDVELATVVDWTEASIGDPAWDLAFCRANTALSYGLEAADRLRDAYLRHAPAPIQHLPWWDLVATCRLAPDVEGWRDSANFLGSSDLTASDVGARFHEFASRAREGVRKLE
jgi:aminoglycoside phosphotransferase (APT) family kinase protein